MIYVIDEKDCAACGLCADVCPVTAVSEGIYRIDPTVCTGCGQCADSCPVEAIKPGHPD